MAVSASQRNHSSPSTPVVMRAAGAMCKAQAAFLAISEKAIGGPSAPWRRTAREATEMCAHARNTRLHVAARTEVHMVYTSRWGPADRCRRLLGSPWENKYLSSFKGGVNDGWGWSRLLWICWQKNGGTPRGSCVARQDVELGVRCKKMKLNFVPRHKHSTDGL